MSRKSERITIYFVSFLIYVTFGVYNFVNNSQWLYDNIITIVFLILVYSLNKWLKLQKTGLIIINIALLTHNLGVFGYYSWKNPFIEYDTIVHFISSCAASYVLFNFVARKLHIKKKQRVKHTVVDEHMAVIFFLVIASVSFLGSFVELIEYGGYRLFGEGEGILFTGAGDLSNDTSCEGQYIDTMEDIIVNTLGSIVGTLLYYLLKYKKKPWLRY